MSKLFFKKGFVLLTIALLVVGGFFAGTNHVFADPVNPTLSVTNSPVVYNGLSQAATVVGSVAGTVSNVKYGGSDTVPTNAGTYAITANFLPDDPITYNSLTNASAGNFIISQVDLTITADAKSKVYGAVDPALTYQITSGTLVGADAFSGSLSRAAGENVGTTYAILQGSLANSNYTIVFASANFAITPKAITVTPDSGQTKIYGQADPAFTYTAPELVGDDTLAGALSRAAGSNVGTYAFTVGTLANPNYTLTVASVNFTIIKATPSITWSDPTGITYGTALSGVQLNATSSGDGIPAYTPTAGTVLNAGAAQELSVTYGATSNYNSATQTVHINVARATPSITWSDPADITLGAALSPTELNATSTGDGTPTYTPPAGTFLSAGNAQALSVTFGQTTNFNSATRAVHINVIDPVAVAFNTISSILTGHNIANNLNTVNSGNVTSFSGLSFEKRIDIADHATALGTLLFTGALDLHNDATKTFLQGLGTALDQSNGHIKFDVHTSAIFSDPAIGASLIMYNIAPGVTETNLVVRDDSGAVISPSGIVSGFAYNAGTVTFSAAHFTQFDIDTTPPVIAGHADIGPVDATSASGAVVTYTAPNATDNIDPDAAATCTPASGSTFAAGDTTVTCNKTDTAGNAATPVTFVVHVVKIGQTITFGALSGKTYGDADFTASATASSSLGVSFSSQTSSVCTVSGSTVHIVKIGTCTVRAAQSGNGQYNAASNVDRSFAIATRAITVTAVANTKTTDGSTSASATPSITSGTLVSGDTANFIETYDNASVGTGKTLTPSGSVNDGNSGNNYAVTFHNVSTGIILAATQSVPNDSGDATVNNTNPEVVITNPTQAVDVSITSGTTNPTIDVSSFISSGTGTLPEINITSANAGNVNVAIPASTTVTSADASWNGIIAAPTVTTVTLPEVAGETRTLSTAIQVGFTGAKLSFNKAVRLLLPGQAGKRAGYIRTGIDFTEITDICTADNQATGDALAADGDCKINVGADLAIWTKHFTSFASFSSVSPSGSGGLSSGGGGGGNTPAPISTPVLTLTPTPTPAPVGQVLGATTIVGCDNRTTGFSTVTGQSCAGNYVAPAPVGQVLGAQSFNFTLSLKQGSKGNEVKELQKFLNNAGYNVGKADGVFGAKVKAAVIKFQVANKIKGDGVVGPKVRALLNK